MSKEYKCWDCGCEFVVKDDNTQCPRCKEFDTYETARSLLESKTKELDKLKKELELTKLELKDANAHAGDFGATYKKLK